MIFKINPLIFILTPLRSTNDSDGSSSNEGTSSPSPSEDTIDLESLREEAFSPSGDETVDVETLREEALSPSEDEPGSEQ